MGWRFGEVRELERKKEEVEERWKKKKKKKPSKHHHRLSFHHLFSFLTLHQLAHKGKGKQSVLGVRPPRGQDQSCHAWRARAKREKGREEKNEK